MKKIELLSPARDAGAGIAAVNCGADAVYIGAERFGARKAAGNDMQSIARLIRHAHLYHARVYLTMNTILRDQEVEEAVHLANMAWNEGIDGLIIQDMGLLAASLPPVPLIASTQTDNRTVEKVQFLEKIGFSRVILARELSLDEIRGIRAGTEIELEAFVHGALCVSYSGQCWISQAVTGRSANRGECAQLCRSAYDLVDANGRVWLHDKHLLSLKDLNLSAVLRDLIDAGITSFKIEGRLKDDAYVKNITAFYRQKIDLLLGSDRNLGRASSGSCRFHFTPDPDRTFNRGYTSHFVQGRQSRLSSMLSQKSLGKKVGKVIRSEINYLYVQAEEEIHPGDGICYFDAQEELQGFFVNRAENNRIWPAQPRSLPAGTILYRNADKHFIKAIEHDACIRTIGVDFEFAETAHGFALRAADEDQVVAVVELRTRKEEANNPQLSADNIEKLLLRTGNTPFYVRSVKILWQKAYFLQVAALNGLRREVLGRLQEERISGYRRTERKPSAADASYPAKKLTYRGNVMNSLSDAFYRSHGVENIQRAFEQATPEDEPVIMNTRYCLKYELDQCPLKQEAPDDRMKEPLWIVDKSKRYRLSFDCKKCEMSVHLSRSHR